MEPDRRAALLRAVGAGASLEQLCLRLQESPAELMLPLLDLELAGDLRAEAGLCWSPCSGVVHQNDHHNVVVEVGPRMDDRFAMAGLRAGLHLVSELARASEPALEPARLWRRGINRPSRSTRGCCRCRALRDGCGWWPC